MTQDERVPLTTLCVQADLREGEKAYPIYNITVRWSAADKPDDKHDLPSCYYEGLPAGRHWDSTSWHQMEREELPTEELAARLQRDWWPTYAATKFLEPADLTITVVLHNHDVWCSGWFSHHTFDVGMDDAAVLDSFGRYVDRILFSEPEDRIGGILMGANDHWRWHGCVDGNPQGIHTPPPCRCPSCKKKGLIRIDH